MSNEVVFAGWDVAGWTCPSRVQNGADPKSQDALVVLRLKNGAVTFLAARVGNFADDILAGNDLVKTLLPKEFSSSESVLAIDAPLGWPQQFQDLLSWSWNPSTAAAYSRLLYRETDRAHRGQSAIVRSIGAASTKALGYLQRRAYRPSTQQPGVYSLNQDTAIETYPAAVQKHATAQPQGAIARGFASLRQALPDRTDDAESALWCALIAATWGHALRGAPSLSPPPAGISVSEGWIWAP